MNFWPQNALGGRAILTQVIGKCYEGNEKPNWIQNKKTEFQAFYPWF
jgi:hypothetical protein